MQHDDIERKLREYGDHKRRIEKIETEAQRLINKKDDFAERLLRPPLISDVKVDGGKQGDPVYETAQIMVDAYWPYIQSLFTQIADLRVLMISIDVLITRAQLTEAEQEYIELRYFAGKSHARTAADMGYCEDHARRYKKSALGKICRKNVG